MVLTDNPQPLVVPMRGPVATVDVEADAFEPRIGLDLALQVLVESTADSAAARFGQNVEGLDPQHGAVAPVAPLVRREQTANDAAVVFGDPVAPFGRVGEDGFDATAHRAGVELQVL